MKTKYLIISAILIVLSISLVWWNVWRERPFSVPTGADIAAQYRYLTNHLLSAALLPDRFPVHISRSPSGVDPNNIAGTWNASGTALMKENRPEYVVTAAHCFARPGFFFFTIVVPREMSRRVWAIESVQLLSATNDVALAKVGDAKLIPQLWFGKHDTWVRHEVSKFTNQVFVRSQVTGKSYRLIGSVVETGVLNPSKYYIMDYKGAPAESGSGVLYSNTTFVMNLLSPFDRDMQRKLGIEPREGGFTLLTAININWP
ncbi:MAG: hypothetical protein HYW65_02270 [Candidatus Liptonbacteria bacterium]|nr:hypothetical protein [Candidatus Liptonbacteria bacterium]